jgi:hypothetical protein
MESLFAELAANKVLGTLPRTELAEYLGGGGYMGATLEKAGLIPGPSMAQVRRTCAWRGTAPLQGWHMYYPRWRGGGVAGSSYQATAKGAATADWTGGSTWGQLWRRQESSVNHHRHR